jgi:hypothetical protein
MWACVMLGYKLGVNRWKVRLLVLRIKGDLTKDLQVVRWKPAPECEQSENA